MQPEHPVETFPVSTLQPAAIPTVAPSMPAEHPSSAPAEQGAPEHAYAAQPAQPAQGYPAPAGADPLNAASGASAAGSARPFSSSAPIASSAALPAMMASSMETPILNVPVNSAAVKVPISSASPPVQGYPTPEPGPPPHHKPVHIESGAVTFESCMASCKGKWQSADIAMEVSQGNFDCKSKCAKYAAAGTEIVAKRAPVPAPVPSPPAPAPKPHYKAGFESFEACMEECKGQWQSAEIAMEISTGAYDCESKCDKYAVGASEFGIEKRVASPPAPPQPNVDMSQGKVTYESCMAGCKGNWQYAEIAMPVSQGSYDCEEACAKYDSEEVDVEISRRQAQTLPGTVTPPLQPYHPSKPPKVAFEAGFESYEECMASCKGDWQSAEIAMPVSQGHYDCGHACAKYAAGAAETTIGKREIPPPLPMPVAAPFQHRQPEVSIATGHATYESCLKGCGTAGAFGEFPESISECRANCATLSEDGTALHIERRAMPDTENTEDMDKMDMEADKPAYDKCVANCIAQELDPLGDFSGIEQACKDQCAPLLNATSTSTSSSTTSTRPRATEDELVERHQPGPMSAPPATGMPPMPPSAPGYPVPAGKFAHANAEYEACMEECKGDWQYAEIAMPVSQGHYDCGAGCAQYMAEETEVAM
ncbi:hypothetical protein F4777DRAFT_133807 [Nemania sp. FL0916]|nr:hypothetical protein F4777DRAFT_133807 [Nemania sp. FL0916]